MFIICYKYVKQKLYNMKEKIEKRLAVLYKEQVNLTDKNRHWIQPNNSPSRGDLIKMNYVLIRELEDLLKS